MGAKKHPGYAEVQEIHINIRGKLRQTYLNSSKRMTCVGIRLLLRVLLVYVMLTILSVGDFVP